MVRQASQSHACDGIKRKDEIGKERFFTGGVAVLVTDSANRPFIATALHVFDNPSEHGRLSLCKLGVGRTNKKPLRRFWSNSSTPQKWAASLYCFKRI